MSDDFTILNPGVGGDVMDETSNTYLTPPYIRKRPRVVITGEGIDDIVPGLNTNLTGSEYGLVSRIIPQYPGISTSIFNYTTLVPFNTETTITSYTVPATKKFYFIGFNVSGNANALFKLYVDGNVVLAGRNSVANLTLTLTYAMSPFQIDEGITVALKVIHQAGSVTCDFEGTILGYLI